MLTLLEAFLQIMLRRKGPEDLPDSRFLLLLLLVLYLACQVPVAVMMFGWGVTTGSLLVLDVLLLCGYFWVVLRVAGKPQRFQQTLAALLGTGALLSLLQTPLVYLARLAIKPAEAPAVVTLGLLALLVWTVVVHAHIATRALDRGVWPGVAVALTYFLLSYQLTSRLTPGAG